MVSRSAAKDAPSSAKLRSSVATEEVDFQRDPPPSGLRHREVRMREERSKEEGRWEPEDAILLVESDESGGEEEVNVQKDHQTAEKPKEFRTVLSIQDFHGVTDRG
jgi:hypothetical protein